MQRYKVLVTQPSAGTISEGSAQASWLSSYQHDTERLPSCNSGPNFNACWMAMLNGERQLKYTHGAMVHADLTVIEDVPGMRWLDKLIEEMEAHALDFISVPMAIKDHRSLTSSGIGNPENRWNPWRRFTTGELDEFPTTFTAEEVGYGDKFLLHNHALCVWDLRNPKWFETDEDGCVRAIFNFEERIALDNGEFRRAQESEDWAFSRCLWKMGMKTGITRRVKTLHQGGMNYANYGGCGIWQHDEDTKAQWEKDECQCKKEMAAV